MTIRRFATRFKREVQYAEALDHPHVLELYEAGETPDGTLFFAMQYIDGPDLGLLLRRDGPMSLAQALSILGQIADALDCAHASGLVHRDVKPGNIIVANDVDRPHAYLTDFGLSKNPGTDSFALTRMGQLIGTLAYTAPEEILAAEPRGHLVDVYSLGCVLYEALTGAPPFVREREIDVLYAHVGDPRPRATAVALRPARGHRRRDREGDGHLRHRAVPELRRADRCRAGVAGGHRRRLRARRCDCARARRRSSRRACRHAPDALGLARREIGLGAGSPSPSRTSSCSAGSRLSMGLSRPTTASRAATRRITRRDDGAFEVEDEHSRNGTFVNGDRLEAPRVLRTGDELKIGATVFVATAPERMRATRPPGRGQPRAVGDASSRSSSRPRRRGRDSSCASSSTPTPAS